MNQNPTQLLNELLAVTKYRSAARLIASPQPVKLQYRYGIQQYRKMQPKGIAWLIERTK